MRTSIKEVKSKYFINEQEGVIVCVISGYTCLLGECENFEVKGISRCHNIMKRTVVDLQNREQNLRCLS